MLGGRDRPRNLVLLALMAGQFLSAIEATAVATAMPTAVTDLGGVSHYSWAFSAYLLTSTTTVPLFGKLADLHGRLRVYLICTVIFLVGSALCGAAQTFIQLIVFRALQGIGAGGVIPISIVIVGDIYSLEERGRMQGVFSAVWAFASLVGPVVGGVVTDALSWRWVFYFTIPFGLLSAILLKMFHKENVQRQEHGLDVLGTVLLTVTVVVLLIGHAWWMFVLAALGFTAFVIQEKRAAEPMLPLDLFKNRVIAVASAGSLLLGCLLFSVTAYVPMYAQGVLHGSARDAGVALIPMMLSWPISSTLAGRLMLRWGYRPLVRAGSVTALGGLLYLAFGVAGSASLAVAMFVTGLGMGLLGTPYLVSTQTAVPWNRRGVATSSSHFFRTIGGSICVAALGSVLNLHMKGQARVLGGSGFTEGLHAVFAICAVLGVLQIVIALLFPGGAAADHAHVETAAEARA